MPDSARPQNRLLAELPKEEYKRIASNLKLFPLVYGEIIFKPGDVIYHVYFPESGIISLLSSVDTDSALEIGIVGSEGLAGLPVFLGVKTTESRAVVQAAGTAMRISTTDFTRACRDGNDLPRRIKRYVHSLMTQIAQGAACNRFHPVERRLARWLLMTQDRVQADEFQITQAFLSNMLGVRREAVSHAARGLQRSEIISYSRGKMTVRNRQGLEKTACTCYRVIAKEYEYLPWK